MTTTRPTPRVGKPRGTRMADARHQDRNRPRGRLAAGRGDGRACAPATRPVVGLDASAAGGPGGARPLDLFLGHFGTHTRGAVIPCDVNLLSSAHVDADNHGAAPRAAEGRVRGVRRLARDLAQRADGRSTPGLPGWAYRVGYKSAVTGAWRQQSHRAAVVRCETRHAGPGYQTAQEPQRSLPLRCSQRRRSSAALETVPRQGVAARWRRQEGGAHG